MSKKILVVDDEEDFRIGVESHLRRAGYRTRGESSGSRALLAMTREPFDLVLSDIRMPDIGGLELTRRIKSAKKEIPIVLMTGFAEILETQDAHALGADAFIPKPFAKDDLLAALDRCFQGKEAPESQRDEDFCRVHIDDFISGSQIQFDIFIRLAGSKYVKIAKQGIDLSIERIKAYKAKGVRYLFLRKEDFRAYVGFVVSLGKAIRTSAKISGAAKINYVRHTSELISEQLHSPRLDADIFENSKAFVETTMQILGEEPEVAVLLESLRTHVDYLFSHSVAVSLYGVMLARWMGWISPANMFKIAVGGLLHDIGKKEIKAELLNKPRVEWSADEVELYETHPLRGLEVIQRLSSLSDDVRIIVKAHHEDCLGHGFPSGLKERAIHPLARLISVCNEFARLIIKCPDGNGMPIDEAVIRLHKLHRESLDHSFFKALAGLCRVELPA